MPQSKWDLFFASNTFRKIVLALHNSKFTSLLLRLGLPIYEKINDFSLTDFNVFAVGQSHLDSAWNWRWKPDTAPYKLSHTIGYNLDRMKRFPERRKSDPYKGGFKFSFPAPAHYEYMEKTWPKSFQLLKKRVKEGRWELLGGMWVESDGNVVDGEAFVRQRLYGQKYYEERFGKRALVAWLPDTFGFAASLPQILKKSGAIGFHTTKITWNQESLPGTGHEFPFGWFYWEGPDGTKLLSSNLTNKWRGLEAIGKYKQHSRLAKNPEDRTFSYSTDVDSEEEFGSKFSKEFVNHVLWEYGEGDGGHGPMDVEVIIADAAEQLGAMQHTKANIVYKLIERDFGPKLPVWKDELYLERHRGVQTTLHRLKQQNRISEVRLLTLEKMASILFTQGMKFPTEQFNNAWKKVLFNQFHDILPGTSIEEVYDDTDKDYYNIILPTLNQIEEKCVEYYTSSIRKPLGEKDIVVFYPTQWQDSAKISIQKEKEKARILFVEKPQGIGFDIVNATQLEKINAKIYSKPIINEIQDPARIKIDTEKYETILNLQNGSLTSLKTKGSEYEICKTSLNMIKLFDEDEQISDAWDIDPFYREKLFDTLHIEKHRVYEERIITRVIFSFEIGEKSEGTLTYEFSSAMPYIECNLNIDWQERSKFLRTEFATTLDAEHYATGIPYGVIERPTNSKLPLQRGMWEVPGSKFIDMSDRENNAGLAILVFDKYGFNCDRGEIGISLLRSPKYGPPSPTDARWYDESSKKLRKKTKDLGNHSIRWAIYPHEGDRTEANVYQKAESFNFSPLAISLSNKANRNPESQKTNNSLINASLFGPTIDAQNIHIYAIKAPYTPEVKVPVKHQEDTPIVIRLFEFQGKDTTCTLEWKDFEPFEAIECNLLEDPIDSKDLGVLENGKIKVNVRPWEIKTLILKQLSIKH